MTKNREIINKSNKHFEIINKAHNREIEKLKKELKENEEYFKNYKEDRIKAQEKINTLNKSIDDLNNEKQKIEKKIRR